MPPRPFGIGLASGHRGPSPPSKDHSSSLVQKAGTWRPWLDYQCSSWDSFLGLSYLCLTHDLLCIPEYRDNLKNNCVPVSRVRSWIFQSGDLALTLAVKNQLRLLGLVTAWEPGVTSVSCPGIPSPPHLPGSPLVCTLWLTRLGRSLGLERT